MRFGVIVFPGTLSDGDCYYVLDKVMHQQVRYVWHRETDLSDYQCLILPGGFSYGDYLRPGAIARFSPVMAEVARAAASGKLVLGICNGFQVLCESGLLPGVLMINRHLQFRCQWVDLRVENSSSPFTSKCLPGQVLRLPISHYEGNYYTDEGTLAELEAQGRVTFRYCTPKGEITDPANPNGALNNIAGIVSRGGNVLGLMPHPERAGEALLGGTDGNFFWESIVQYCQGKF